MGREEREGESSCPFKIHSVQCCPLPARGLSGPVRGAGARGEGQGARSGGRVAQGQPPNAPRIPCRKWPGRALEGLRVELRTPHLDSGRVCQAGFPPPARLVPEGGGGGCCKKRRRRRRLEEEVATEAAAENSGLPAAAWSKRSAAAAATLGVVFCKLSRKLRARAAGVLLVCFTCGSLGSILFS